MYHRRKATMSRARFGFGASLTATTGHFGLS
jgi:hypothetical protein